MIRPVSAIFRTFCVVMLASAAMAQMQPANWSEKFNAQGANLRFMEMERKPSSEGFTYIHYFLQAIGIPKNQPYQLWEWQVGAEPKLMLNNVTLRDDAVLLCSGKPGDCSGASEEQVYVLRLDSMKGEPKRFALISNDGKTKLFGSETPFPIQSSGGNCKVTLERKNKNATEITLRGEGFKPNDKVQYAVAGETAGVTLRTRTDAKGEWSVDVSRNSEGQAQINVKGTGCEVTVPWESGAATAQKQ